MKEKEEQIVSDVEQLQKNLANQEMPFGTYRSIYTFTNENIAESLDHFCGYREDHPVLTAMASSDQFFNYLLKGARCIDTFDINRVTKYYFELKKALIESLSYSEFIDYAEEECKNKNQFEALQYWNIISDKVEEDARLFWKTFQEKISEEDWAKIKLALSYEAYQKHNLYLQSRSQYERLQSILKEGYSSKFYETDVFKLPNLLEKKYQEMHMSNIFEYFTPRVGTKIDYMCLRLSPHLEELGRILFYSFSLFQDLYKESRLVEAKELSNQDVNYVYYKK